MNKIAVRIAALSLSLALVAPALAQPDYTDELYSSPPKKRTPFRDAGRSFTRHMFGTQDQGGEVDYYVVDLSARNRTNSTVRSLFIPGWGQYFNEQKIKGGALFITTSLAVAGSYALYQKSNDSFEEYEASGRVDGPAFDDHESERLQASILAGVAVALWTFNVIDAYRNAYNPLWASNSNIELSVIPNGTQLRWNKRF